MDEKDDAQAAIGVYPYREIFQLQKRYNQNGSAPIPYIEVIDEWRKANKFSGQEYEIETALKAKPDFEKQKAEFAKMLAEGDIKGIFKAMKIGITENEDGTITIQSYSPFVKGKPYTLFDLGIDENVLMQNVVEVQGNMDLEGSALTSLPKLRKVKAINFGDCKISDLRSLEEIGGKKVYWDKPESNNPEPPKDKKTLPNTQKPDKGDVSTLQTGQDTDVEFHNLQQNGYIVDNNPTLRDAKTKNPATVVADKIVHKAVKDGEFDDSGMRLNTPESLDAELREAELNPDAPQGNMEVVSLIINSKLTEKLTQRYERMGKVFEEIIKKRTSDIDKLALYCEKLKDTLPPDTSPEVAEQQRCQKYAEGILSVLAEEFGMKWYKPQILVEGEGSGSSCSIDGIIRIGKGVLTRNYTQIIAHEFIHLMQFRDMLADYGIDGLIDIINEIKTLSDSEKENNIFAVLNSQYINNLLKFGSLQKSESGSINDYLSRIYKDEEIDYKSIEDPRTATNEEVDAYANQVIEREAYWGDNHSRLDKTVGAETLTLKDFEEAKLKYKNLYLDEGGTVLKYFDEHSGEFITLGKIKSEDSARIQAELDKIMYERESNDHTNLSLAPRFVYNEKKQEFEEPTTISNQGVVAETREQSEPQTKTKTTITSFKDFDNILKEHGFSDEDIKLIKSTCAMNFFGFYIKIAKEYGKTEIINEVLTELRESLKKPESLLENSKEDISKHAISQFESIKDILFDLLPNQDKFGIAQMTVTYMFKGTDEQIDKITNFIRENKDLLKSALPKSDKNFYVLYELIQQHLNNKIELPKEYLQKQIELITRLDNYKVSTEKLDKLMNPESIEEFDKAYDEYIELFNMITSNPKLRDKAGEILWLHSWGDIKAIKEMYELMKDKLDYFEHPEHFMHVYVDYTYTNSLGKESKSSGNFASKKAQVENVIKLYEDLNLNKPLSDNAIYDFFRNISDLKDVQIELIKDIAKIDSEVLYNEEKSALIRQSIYNVENENQKKYVIEIYKFIQAHPDFEHKNLLMLNWERQNLGKEEYSDMVAQKLLTLFDAKGAKNITEQDCKTFNSIIWFTRTASAVVITCDLVDLGVSLNQIKEFQQAYNPSEFGTIMHREFGKLDDIKFTLADPNIKPEVKEKIREFIKLSLEAPMPENLKGYVEMHANTSVNCMLEKWHTLMYESKLEPAHFEEMLDRALRFEKAGINLTQFDLETLASGHASDPDANGKRAWVYTYDEKMLLDILKNPEIQTKLGRKITIEEAAYFNDLESWQRDLVIKNLKENSSVEDVCNKIKYYCKTPEGVRLFELLEKNDSKIITREGTVIDLNEYGLVYEIYRNLIEPADIEAFCKIFEGEPLEESKARLYIDLASKRGNFAQNIDIAKQYPHITKALMVTDKHHKDIFEILENNTNPYTTEAINLFEKFLEKHPELETKLESLTADYSFMGKGTPLEEINTQETLDMLKKNLNILEQIDLNIIKNGINDGASVSGGLRISTILTNPDLNLEHYNILKDFYDKDNSSQGNKEATLLEIWANSEYNQIYKNINSLKKVISKVENLEQLQDFLMHTNGGDPEFTLALIDNLSIDLKNMYEIIGKRDYNNRIEDNQIEKAKAFLKTFKQQGITDKQAYIMLYNLNVIDKNLADRILKKAEEYNSTKHDTSTIAEAMLGAKPRLSPRKIKVHFDEMNQEEAILYDSSSLAQLIRPEQQKLVDILLEDKDFNISRIRCLLNLQQQFDGTFNPNKNAVNIAKTYKQKGLSQNEAFIMMANSAITDLSLAKQILSRVESSIDKSIEMHKKENPDSEPVSAEQRENTILDKICQTVVSINDNNIEFAKYLFTKTEFKDIPIGSIHSILGSNNPTEAIDLCENYKRYELTVEQAVEILTSKGSLSVRGMQTLNKKLGRDFVNTLSPSDKKIASDFVDVIDVKNINEISIGGKKKFLRALVDSKAGTFNISEQLSERLPIVPRNVDEYCPLLRSIVRSIGIETEALAPEQRIQIVQTSISDLSKSLARLSDKDFADLEITLEFSREEFIEIVREKTKGLSDLEKRKVYDYYGFELHHNNRNVTGYSLTGYPVNLNNGAKLALIENPATKAVVESLREDVIRFSRDNKIKCNNPQVEQLLNEVLDGLPEIRTMVGKEQHLSFGIVNDVTKLTYNIKSSSEYKNVIKLLDRMQLSDIQKLGLKIEDGVVICNNEKLKSAITSLITKFPEIKDSIGIVKIGSHDFDVMQHSLKVMQKIVQEPQFNNLTKSDQKIMLLASLLHDITKSEGRSDRTHAYESAFDAFYIAQKFKLTREESLKLYTLIDNHEWLGEVNTKKTEESLTKALQRVAFYLQNDNLFDLSLMFTHADLKAVRKDNSFHDKVDGPSRTNFRGEVHSFGEAADIHAERIREYIRELKASQPLTPVTQIPTTDIIMSKIGSVDADGKARDKAGNIINGLYVRESDGLVIIKHNEVTDWEAIGFANGTTSKGITGTGKTRVKEYDNGKRHEKIIEEDYETGNIHYFMHGLDYPNQLIKFEAFPLVDSRVMLSLTYLERPESKPRGFRPQGILLDFRTKYTYGGGETDSGSGTDKFVDDFIKNYCFGGHRQKDRTMVSDLIKEATGITDDEYIKFVEENQNKQWSEIQPPELRNKLIKALADGIISTERGYKRSYDEFYGSNPERVMATFAYNEDANELIGNAVEFVNKREKQSDNGIGFLTQFNRDHKIPIVLLGD